MRYVDFRDSICRELRRNRKGLTWPELRDRLDLPYKSPCSEWVSRTTHRRLIFSPTGLARSVFAVGLGALFAEAVIPPAACDKPVRVGSR